MEYRDFSTAMNGLYAILELAALRQEDNSFIAGCATSFPLDCQVREDS